MSKKDGRRPPQPGDNKGPPKDKPPFPNPPKEPAKPGTYEPKKADPNGVLSERDREAARQAGSPENLPLTPHAKSVLVALYGRRELSRAA